MRTMLPILETELGRLYEGDCLQVLGEIPSDSVDLTFADPPFNLGKKYSSKIDDSKSESQYLAWCESWLNEMVRVLKPGGSLFLWNLPKWNLPLGNYLRQKLTFRHWISVDIKYSLPIPKRLYPSHYSLLYFVKGDLPAIFHPDRLSVPCCRHCGGEIPDYGGYKDKMNPKGVNLSDVWTDIPPVRHKKYKNRDTNELSLKVMDRIISLASGPGSVVVDPFGGAGTTYAAAELLGRQWIGSELDCSAIIQRFNDLETDRKYLRELHSSKNTLFKRADLQRMREKGKPLSKKYRITHEDSDLPESLKPVDLFTSV